MSKKVEGLHWLLGIVAKVFSDWVSES